MNRVMKMQRLKQSRLVVLLPAGLVFWLLALIHIHCGSPGLALADEEALWSALRSGDHFALLRHAIAPGTGDPPQFTLDNCSTQRNLSDEGRKQAKEIGARFRANGIHEARVFSSQWCRCLETAKLLAIGQVRELPVLNSFFQYDARRDSQTRLLTEWLSGQDLGQPVVLVTHQVNITALTNIYPGSGELVIVHRSKTGQFSVAGAIKTR